MKARARVRARPRSHHSISSIWRKAAARGMEVYMHAAGRCIVPAGE